MQETELQLPQLEETAIGNSKPAELHISIGDNEFVTEKKSGIQKKPAAKKNKKKRFELPAGRGDKWK